MLGLAASLSRRDVSGTAFRPEILGSTLCFARE